MAIRLSGWWWPRQTQVWACERPSVLRVDERGLLHCATGPAMAFHDGWRIHAWHGIRIPAPWIEQRQQIDPRLALTHENIEHRRALAEILGWDRVLAQLQAKSIARDDYGDLLEVELPDSGRERFVRVRCATDRTFAIPVPLEMRTPLEAVAWTYSLSADEYARIECRT